MRDQKVKLMESLWFRVRLELCRDIVPTDKITTQQPAFLLSTPSVYHSLPMLQLCQCNCLWDQSVNLINGIILVKND